VVVSDGARGHEPRPQGELPFDHSQRAGTQRDSAVISRFGLTTIDACDPRFVNTESAVHKIDI
jgi:hypothetical protein